MQRRSHTDACNNIAKYAPKEVRPGRSNTCINISHVRQLYNYTMYNYHTVCCECVPSMPYTMLPNLSLCFFNNSSFIT